MSLNEIGPVVWILLLTDSWTCR